MIKLYSIPSVIKHHEAKIHLTTHQISSITYQNSDPSGLFRAPKAKTTTVRNFITANNKKYI